MRPLLRYWRIQAWMDWMLLTRDPRLTLLYVVSDTAVNLAGITAILLLAERFSGLGDWSRAQILFMMGFAALVRGTIELFFNYNVGWISRRIGRGQLDHCLIQPRSLVTTLLTEGFAPFSGSAGFMVGLALSGWAATKLPIRITPAWVGICALNLAAATTIVLAFSYLWGSLAFWAPVAAEEISSNAMGMMMQLRTFPLDRMGPALKLGLLTVVPAGFVAWMPGRYLAGLDVAWRTALASSLAGALLALLAAIIFHFGIRNYARTGSQRYLSFGHRR